ncbi:hypothetical protein SAMD00019534_028490, partial [Acytostelium subglobosum LB1]|uniref:hypothetical protein n=1 Tax=Acytostelium subglobosum LB1 TaxID=1410327 RepID=UPI000644A118
IHKYIMASARYTKRLQKELLDLQTNPPGGISVEEANNFERWVINILGSPGTIYSGEVFRLQFRFNSSYPLESPEVVFIGLAPVHPHIYSNGHICLSIRMFKLFPFQQRIFVSTCVLTPNHSIRIHIPVYDSWSPALTVSSVCLSILSMLSSCTEKTRPHDDAGYVSKTIGKSPKNTRYLSAGHECQPKILN